MTEPDASTELDQVLATRLRKHWDQVQPRFRPPPTAPARRRRISPGVAAAVAVVAIGAPAAVALTIQNYPDKAFTDMGVGGAPGAPGRYHLILRSEVSADLTVRLYGADRTARAENGKTGDCLFAEAVVNGASTGGTGWCAGPVRSASSLRAGQFTVVQLSRQLPAGTNVTASKGPDFEQTVTSNEGFLILPPLEAGKLHLTYELDGGVHSETITLP